MVSGQAWMGHKPQTGSVPSSPIDLSWELRVDPCHPPPPRPAAVFSVILGLPG